METKKYKIIETNRDCIVREIDDLDMYQADSIYNQLLNNYSVRNGYNNIKIVELWKKNLNI